MRRLLQWPLLTTGACGVAVLVALFVSALPTAPRRTFAASTADIALVATLHKGQHICESPIESEGAFRTAVFWTAGVGSSALVKVHAGTTARAPIISEAVLAGTNGVPASTPVRLTKAVDSGAPVTICLSERHATMTLYGGSPSYGGPTIIGSSPGTALWLQLQTSKPQSLLASLPVAFRRASLFRPTWVGAWTFWVLLVGLVAVLPAGLICLHSAARDEPERQASRNLE